MVAVGKLKECKLSFEHILSCLSTNMKGGERGKDKKKSPTKSRKGEKKEGNSSQVEPLDKKLITVYICAARVMYIDTNIFPTL
jgi:hypothetical protein